VNVKTASDLSDSKWGLSHSAMAMVTPSGMLAEQHRKMAEPGSAKK